MKRLLFALLLIGCLSQTSQKTIHVKLIIDSGQEKVEKEVELKEGATVLDLLQVASDVKYKESAWGIFVESINGVANDSQKNLWWIFYVNDVSASVSCDKYILKEGDVVLWKLMQFS